MEEFIDLPRMRDMISQALEMPESEFSELTEEMTLNGRNRPEEIDFEHPLCPFPGPQRPKSGGHYRVARHYRPEADGPDEIAICFHREP